MIFGWRRGNKAQWIAYLLPGLESWLRRFFEITISDVAELIVSAHEFLRVYFDKLT